MIKAVASKNITVILEETLRASDFTPGMVMDILLDGEKRGTARILETLDIKPERTTCRITMLLAVHPDHIQVALNLYPWIHVHYVYGPRLILSEVGFDRVRDRPLRDHIAENLLREFLS